MKTRTKQKLVSRLCQSLLLIATGMFTALYVITPREADAQSTNGLALITSQLPSPTGLTLGPHQRLFVSDSSDGDVYRLLPTGTLLFEAGGLESPQDIVFDRSGNLYVADATANQVYRMNRRGDTTVIADNLTSPCCLAFDAKGNLLVSHFLAAADGASPYNGAITRISPEGRQTLVASGFLDPQGLLVDHQGNILITAEGFFDSGTNAASVVIGSGLFKIDELGQVSRILDVGSISPSGLALSSQGTLFFSGVTPQEGAVFITGGGTFEPFVTGLTQPRGLAVDKKSLYVADEKAGQVWRVDLKDHGTNLVGGTSSSAASSSTGNTETNQDTSEDLSRAGSVDPTDVRQFEKMWGYHGKPDYSKIPVTPEGVPHAPGGVTCVIGHVVDSHYWGLPNVTIRLGHKATRSNSSGYWMLVDVPSGNQVYMIDGRSADYEDTHYPIALVAWELYANQPNVLPYEAYLPVLDTAHSTRIDPNHETVHTTPLIPGLEIHIPAHTKITSVDGLPVTEVTTARVPPGQPIYPMGLMVDVGNHFTLQPGGAVCSKQVRVLYNNPAKFPAKTHVQLWEYSPIDHGGWFQYGIGTVSKNKQQIVPDKDAGFNRFGCGIGGYANTPSSGGGGGSGPGPGPCQGADCCPTVAPRPVVPSTGVVLERQTDFVIPGLMPIVLKRTTRNLDANQYDFGVGTFHNYESRLYGPAKHLDGSYIDFGIPGDTIYGFMYQTNFPVHTYVCTSDYRMAGAKLTQVQSSILPTSDGFNYFLQFKDGTTYSFDGHAFLWQIRDANYNRTVIDREISFGFSGLNYDRPVRITQPGGRYIAFTYNNAGLVSKVTDSSERSTGYVYDDSFRLVAITNIVGGVTTFAWDGSNNPTNMVLPNQVVAMQNFFDSSNRITNQIVADGGSYSFSYADAGGVITQSVVTMPEGGVATRNYTGIIFGGDSYTGGIFTQFTTNDVDALGNTNVYVRGPSNEILQSIDPLGRTNAFVYDANMNVLAVTNAQGKVTSFTYEPSFNRLTSVTDPLEHTTSFGYDGQGNLTSTTNALSKVTTITYNQFGQPLTVTDPLNNTHTFTYNASADLVGVTDPLGNHVTRVLDTLGRLIALIDPLGRPTEIVYGDQLSSCMSCGSAGADLPISITDPLSGVTSFKYDAVGNLTNVIDALSHTVSYGYDPMARLTSRTDQLNNTETYEYDKDGNVTNFVDRRGVSIEFNYDILDRRTGVVYAAGDSVRYLYDNINRITNIVDSIAGSQKITYDTLDRLTQVIDINGTITCSYNDANLRTTMTVVGQNAVSYLYDNANRLTNVVQGTFTSALSYDDDGRRTKLVLPNGINTLYNYDVASRLTSTVYQASSTNTITYTYNQIGNRSSQASALSIYNLPSAISTSFYDAANHQLAFGSYSLLYDLDGNVTNIVNGTTTNQLLWSARNQLTNMIGAVTATFFYDGLAHRITRTVNSTTEKYLYDGLDIIQQLNNSGTVAVNYLRGPGIDETWERIDVGTINTNRMYLADAIGSIIALADTNRMLQTEYSYEPFGVTTTTVATNSNCYEFTGRENDGTGLYYYRARYYQPVLGRFVSEDPIGSRRNAYVYAANDPIFYVDPLGLYDFNAQETQSFLLEAYLDATAGPIAGLQNIANDLGRGSAFDFRNNEHWDDTFCVNGRTYHSDEFGNFIGGFQGQAFDDVYNSGIPTALLGVKGVGLLYHIIGDTLATNDRFDKTGFPAINAGAYYEHNIYSYYGKYGKGCPCK